MKYIKINLLLLFILFNQSLFSYSETFSCNYGTRAACLDYNSKIVDSDSTCFSKYTCGFSNDFVCADDYNDLTNKYNNLVNEYDELVSEYNNLIESKENIEFCLRFAKTIEKIKECFY